MAQYFFPVILASKPGEITMMAFESSNGSIGKTGVVDENSGKSKRPDVFDVLSQQGTLENPPYPVTFNYLYNNFSGKTGVTVDSIDTYNSTLSNLNFIKSYEVRQLYSTQRKLRGIKFESLQGNKVIIIDIPGKNLQYSNVPADLGNFNPVIPVIPPEFGIVCKKKETCHEAVTLKGEATVINGLIDFALTVRYRQKKSIEYVKSSENVNASLLSLPTAGEPTSSEYDDGPCPILKSDPSTWDISVVGNGKKGITNTSLKIDGAKSHINTKNYKYTGECLPNKYTSFGVALSLNKQPGVPPTCFPGIEFGDPRAASGLPGSPPLPMTLKKLRSFGTDAAKAGTLAYASWYAIYSNGGKTTETVAQYTAGAIVLGNLMTILAGNGYLLKPSQEVVDVLTFLEKIGHFLENPVGRLWEEVFDFTWDAVNADLTAQIAELNKIINEAVRQAEVLGNTDKQKLSALQTILDKVLKGPEATTLLDTLQYLVEQPCGCAS